MSAFSVIIPSRDPGNIVACVAALEKHEAVDRPHIIVVDDGAKTIETARALRGVTWATGIKPFIFSRNINIGIQLAGRHDVVLLNDDALLKTRLGFTTLSQACDANPKIGIIGATTNITGQPLQKPRGIGLRAVEHFAFVAVYIPRRTIDKVGMLDERYCLDYGVEDRDYCEAVRHAHLEVAVHDGCYVDHSQLMSSFRGGPTVPRSFAQNLQLFREKWGYV